MRQEPEYRPRLDAGAGAPPPALDDTAEAAQRRAAMLDRLHAVDALHDPAVARALGDTPRHLFLPRLSLAEAYENVAVATRWERGAPISSVSQPEIVALMLEQLRVVPGMRALEIGAGSGYNAALLAALTGPAGSVTTIELDPELADGAADHLAMAGYPPERARVIAGDGWAGHSAGAPWDRIQATAGVWDIPPAWFEQLAEGGVMVVPLWLGVTDVSVALRKRAGALVSESWALCGFVRLRGEGAGQPPLVRLGGRRSLGGPGADTVAGRVSALLSQPARRSHWENPGPGFLPTLALLAGSLLTLWREPLGGLGRPRGRYALYREGDDGPSLSLISERSSTLMTFGGAAAERFIRERTAAYPARAALGPNDWGITAWPAWNGAPVPPQPESAIRQRTPHWVYDINVGAAVEAGISRDSRTLTGGDTAL